MLATAGAHRTLLMMMTAAVIARLVGRINRAKPMPRYR